MNHQDWRLLTAFFPAKWQELAIQTHAIKGLRKHKPPNDLLRLLLVHIACGYSLRETVVRAQQSGLATMSDVALLKRLRKSKDWLYHLCAHLFMELTIPITDSDITFRLLDATHVKEPGQTGSNWRIHYSFQVPEMKCDFFKITKTEGEGTGEDLSQFPIQHEDYIIVDRGYSRASGIAYANDHGAFVCVRVNYQTLILLNPSQTKRFPLIDKLQSLTTSLTIDSWLVDVLTPEQKRVQGRICAIRKTEAAIQAAYKKLKRRASRKGHELSPTTLILAEYVIVFTTFPEEHFPAEKVLEWYRIRWQIELVFKRFKQITRLGHLPKYHDDSAKAWLYGKLFIALLTEKIMRHAELISPWGITSSLQSLAQLPVYVPSN